jgi:hypothetical protein
MDITDIPLLIPNGQHYRVDETLIRCEVQLLITLQDLFMQLCVNLHGIAFHQQTGNLIVTLTLDALNLCQQAGKEGT